jgi:hypothetical protein
MVEIVRGFFLKQIISSLFLRGANKRQRVKATREVNSVEGAIVLLATSAMNISLTTFSAFKNGQDAHVSRFFSC